MIVFVALLATVVKSDKVKQYSMTNYTRQPQIQDPFDCNSFTISLWFRDIDDPECEDIQLFQINKIDSLQQINNIGLHVYLNKQYKLITINFEKQRQFLKYNTQGNWFHMIIKNKDSNFMITLTNDISQQTINQTTTGFQNSQCELIFHQQNVQYSNIQIYDNDLSLEQQFACQPGCEQCIQSDLFQCLVCNNLRLQKLNGQCKCPDHHYDLSQTQCIQQYKQYESVDSETQDCDLQKCSIIPQYQIFQLKDKFIYRDQTYQTCQESIRNLVQNTKYYLYNTIYIYLYYTSFPNCTLNNIFINIMIRFIQPNNIAFNSNGQLITQGKNVTQLVATIQKEECTDMFHSSNQDKRISLFNTNQEIIVLTSSKIWVGNIQNIQLLLIGAERNIENKHIQQFIQIQNYSVKDILINLNEYQIEFQTEILQLIIDGLILDNLNLNNSYLINLPYNLDFNINISHLIIRNCVFTNSSLFSGSPFWASYYNFTIFNSSFYNTQLFRSSELFIELLNIMNCTFQQTLIFYDFDALSMIDFTFQNSTLSQTQIIDTAYSEYILLNNVKLYQLNVYNDDISLFDIVNCDDVDILDLSIIQIQGSMELIDLRQSLQCQITGMLVLDSNFRITNALIQLTSDLLIIRQQKFQNISLQATILLLISSLTPNVHVKLDYMNFTNITIRGQTGANLLSVKLEKIKDTIVGINYLSVSSIFLYSFENNTFCLHIGTQSFSMNNSKLEIQDVSTFQGFLFIKARNVGLQNQIYDIKVPQSMAAIFMGIISNYTSIKDSKFINVGNLLLRGISLTQSSLAFERNIITNTIMNGYEKLYRFVLQNYKLVYFEGNQIYQVEVLESLIFIESVEIYLMSHNLIKSISQQLIIANCKSAYLNNNTIIGLERTINTCDLCMLIEFHQGQYLAITDLMVQNMNCSVLEMITQQEIYLRNFTLAHIQYSKELIYIASENLFKMIISDVNIFAIKALNCMPKDQGGNIVVYLNSEQERLDLMIDKLQLIKCEGTLIQLKLEPYARIQIIWIVLIQNLCESFCFQVNSPIYAQKSRLLLLQFKDDNVFMEDNIYSIIPVEVNFKNFDNYNYQSEFIKRYFQQQIILSFDQSITQFHNKLTNQQNLQFEVLIGNKLSRHIYISSGIPLSNYLIFDRQRNIYKQISLQMQFSMNNELVHYTSCNLMFNQSSGLKQFAFIMKQQNWESLQVISKPNDIVEFKITCAIPSNEQSNFQSTSLVFFTKILECQFGQIQVQLRCHTCSIEQQQYTVEKNSVFCKNKDPQTMNSVKYGLIDLRQGFWRPKIANDFIESCIQSQNSCNGGYKVGNQLCQLGFVGAICSDCDTTNLLGNGMFIKDSLNKCQLCNFQWSDIIKFGFYALLSAYFIFSNTNQFYYILRQRKIDLLVKKKTYRFTQASERTGIYIQFLLQYFQIIMNTNNYSIVSLIPFQFRPNIFDNVSFSYMNYVDCFISPYFNQEIWLYLRLLFLLICYLLILYLYFFLYFIMLKVSKIRYQFFMIFIPIVNVYQNNIISYLSQILLLLIPVDYSNLTWIQARMSYSYFTFGHLQSLAYFIIPQFSIIMLLPIVQLISFKKMQNQMATKIKWVSAFQYLLYSYKENSFLSIYFIKLYSILIIIIVYSLQRQNNVRIIILMATAQIFYLVFQHYQPYQLYRFNNLRIKIQLMFFSQLILMGLSENQSLFVFQYILQLLYYLIFGIVVFIVAKDLIPELDLDNMHWTDKLRGILKMELRSDKINQIRKRFKQAHRSISLQLANSKCIKTEEPDAQVEQ